MASSRPRCAETWQTDDRWLECRRPSGHGGSHVGEPVTFASSRPAAPAKPAPAVVYAPASRKGEQVYVKLPLAPHVVAAFREHASNASRLLDLVTGSEEAAGGVFAQIAKTAAALERDVSKLRAAARRRRRK